MLCARVAVIALAFAASCLAFSAWQTEALASDERPVDCELTVSGKTYIKGVCQFRPTMGGGFQIQGGDYFADVSIVGPGVGEASWNENPLSTHAQSPLGAVERKGACWVGAKATICARDLPPERMRAIAAAQPDGFALFPELPGGSACIGVDGALAAGSSLVLRNCSLPGDRIFIRHGNGNLALAGKQDLCLAAKGSGLPKLVIDTCRSDSATWTTRATATNTDVVRSSDGFCLVIPQIDVPDARFPFVVGAVPCAKAGDKAVKFSFEKG